MDGRGSVDLTQALSPRRGDQHLLGPGGVALGQPFMPGGPGPGDPGRKRAQRAAAVAGVHCVERLHRFGGLDRIARGWTIQI